MAQKSEGAVLEFWGSPIMAMMPILLYVILGGVFAVGFHYYSMKGLVAAGTIALFIGFFVCKNKKKYWDVIVGGLAQFGNSRLILIFIVIGIFSKLLMTGQVGAGFIWLSLRLGITKGAFVVFTLIASAVISMGAGAPIAALFACIPIFYPPGILLGANPAMLVGALLSGIFLGDTLSPSSQVINTTILTQHDCKTGKPGELIPTLKARTPYVAVVGVITAALYFLLGANGGTMGDLEQLGSFADVKGLWMLIPIMILLSICFKTGNLFLGLSYAVVVGLLVGLVTGLFAPSDILSIDYSTESLKGILFEGIYSMTDILISTILLYGLIAVAVEGGMVQRTSDWIMSKKCAQTERGSMTVVSVGVAIVNILLAGCVLPSILLFGAMADRIGQKACLPSNLRSILLTGNATNISAIIPINSAFVMGAVTIINQLSQKFDYLPTVTPFQIFTCTYYCLLGTALCILWVVIGFGLHVKEEEK